MFIYFNNDFYTFYNSANTNHTQHNTALATMTLVHLGLPKAATIKYYGFVVYGKWIDFGVS
jgi:hypothetical protein